MSVAHKANQWLLDNGFIEKVTRGRRSAENNIRLHEAWESGIRFTDWEPKESTDSKGNYTTKNAVASTNTSSNIVADIVYTYPEESFEAYAMVNGKRMPVSMREVCGTCRVSLVGHACESPTVQTVVKTSAPGPHAVTIVGRTTPLPAKRW